MNINITSKYNIGEDIYFADFYDGWIPSKPYKVLEICVAIDSHEATITYMISREEEYMRVAEYICFANYADCLKWCTVHNKSS